MTPYYQDDSVTLWHGDSLAVLRSLPDQSVNCCVTSPPYFGLRDYGIDGQYGLEASPAEYVETMRALFAEVRRVLVDDGTFWLNLGDSYASTTANNGGYSAKSTLAGFTSPDTKGRRANDSGNAARITPGVPAKNLLGIPWRVAFALQDDGWILRNDIIWHKPNTMPSSVLDRMSNAHEHIFLFAKSSRYWFDADPIREPYAAGTAERYAAGYKNPSATIASQIKGSSARGIGSDGQDFGPNPMGRLARDVWTIPTQPFPGAHFAVMPQTLAARCIQAGCKPGGTVLDPFSGSGTTGLAAAKHGRRYIGVDLNSDYLDLSLRTRLAQPGLDFGSAS